MKKLTARRCSIWNDSSFPLVAVVCPRCHREATARECRTKPGVLFEFRPWCRPCDRDGTRVAMVPKEKG